MRRIAVIGPAGAGKSRLAAQLGKLLGIRVLHLDMLFWQPGWVQTPEDEFEALQRVELAAESWIVDAQFDDLIPEWLDAADTVVFVDTSPLRCLWRVSRRRLNQEESIGTPAGSQPAGIHRALGKFIHNQWRYRTSVRPDLLAELARERHGRRIVVLRRESDTRAFLRDVDSPSPAGGTL